MPCSCGATDCDYCGYGQELHYRRKPVRQSDNNTRNELMDMRAKLSDIRYSIVIKKTKCKSCHTDRWDDWDAYQLRNNLEGAITRLEKAITLIEGGDSVVS